MLEGPIHVFSNQQISDSIVIRLQAGCQTFDSRKRQKFFFFSKTPRLPLGSTQHLIQWVPPLLSPCLYSTGHKDDHSRALSAKLWMSEAISLYHFYALMEWKGTTLPILSVLYSRGNFCRTGGSAVYLLGIYPNESHGTAQQ